MIQLSKIDADLSIYKGKKIIIFGASGAGKDICNRLNYYGIEICAFSDNDMKKWGGKFLDCPVIPPFELPATIEKEKNILIQIGSAYDNEIEQQLLNMGISQYVRYDEASYRLRALRQRQLSKKEEIFKPFTEVWNYSKEEVKRSILQNCLFAPDDEMCLLCLPPKTGDNTLIYSLRKAGVWFDTVWHHPGLVDWKMISGTNISNLKIVTAVREPISQNISMLFQMIESVRPLVVDLDEFWDAGGDVGELFLKWLQLEHYIDGKTAVPNDVQSRYDAYISGQGYSFMIQKYFKQFKECVADVMSKPFDKEKGYSILNFSNCEVFVYQIERLNGISSHLFEWLGVPPVSLENSNVGADKFYAKVYRQAQEEIALPQEYLDKCFEEEYLHHFYSEEDIARFKERWLHHVI